MWTSVDLFSHPVCTFVDVLLIVFIFSILDINECRVGQSSCSHICRNTIGSYRCDCPPGYRLYRKYLCEGIDGKYSETCIKWPLVLCDHLSYVTTCLKWPPVLCDHPSYVIFQRNVKIGPHKTGGHYTPRKQSLGGI
jgi:hypothetical protein